MWSCKCVYRKRSYNRRLIFRVNNGFQSLRSQNSVINQKSLHVWLETTFIKKMCCTKIALKEPVVKWIQVCAHNVSCSSVWSPTKSATLSVSGMSRAGMNLFLIDSRRYYVFCKTPFLCFHLLLFFRYDRNTYITVNINNTNNPSQYSLVSWHWGT